MADEGGPARGLTLRSLVVMLVAVFLQAAWISYAERYDRYGMIAENSPAGSAVAVTLVVMALCGGLALLRRTLRLRAAELVVVYAALVISAPLMTQGLWGRITGLLVAIPNNADFKSYESLPSMLWPHGPNLVENGRFDQETLDGFDVRGLKGFETIDAGRFGRVRAPVLEAAEGEVAELAFVLPRQTASGRDNLIPGERHLLSLLLRTDGLQRGSSVMVFSRADDGAERMLYVSSAETRPTLAQPGRFERIGVTPYAVPADLQNRMQMMIRLTGPGRMAIYDVEFINVEAVESLYSGRRVVRASELAALAGDEHDNTVVRPDSLMSLSGLRYLLTGFIPLRQWVLPGVAWSVLIAAMFAGFMGFNMLMRRQWVENERFSFPLTVVPKQLFATTAAGGWALLRNRVAWIGFGVALLFALLRGLNYYNPAIPDLSWSQTPLAQLVDSPLVKAYLKDVTLPVLCLTILSVALLIQTDVLFSLWACFFLFQLWNLAGPALNMNRFPSYPWRFEQNMGAFIAYALLAVYVGRRHLLETVKLAFSSVAKAGTRAAEAREHRVSLALVALSFVFLAWWGFWTGMGVKASLLFFGYMMVLGFATSKIRAECGSPAAYLTPYFGMQFVAAVGGFAMFGTTGMLVATIASGFMTTACFLLIAPIQVEMVELGQHFRVSSRQMNIGLWIGVLGGVLIGGFTVLCWAYGLGADSMEVSWPYSQNWYFGAYRGAEMAADRAMTTGSLFKPETACMNVVSNPDAKGLAIGAVITVVLAVLRSLFMWFPIHPLGYVLAGSHMMGGASPAPIHGAFWLPAFLAWAIRWIVLKIGGARAIRSALVPFCVGMFIACVFSMILFDGIGLILRANGVTNIYSGLP
ncbi:MAG: hypothetical protein FJ222_08935 [Lentisphaerae bacterium]|nr:hypothetical protein [Lentisphaerota bacterium]